MTPKPKIYFLMEHNTGKPSVLEKNAEFKISAQSLTSYETYFIDDHRDLLRVLEAQHIDLLFNICDGGYMGRSNLDPQLIALCDLFNVPYLGKTLKCHHYTNDKNTVYHIAKSLGVNVPMEAYLGMHDMDLEWVADFPVIVKPAQLHGSSFLGQNSVLNSQSELTDHIRSLRQNTSEPFLVQEYLPGREISVALIGNDGDFLNLPLLEVDFSNLPKTHPKIIIETAKEWKSECDYASNLIYKPAEVEQEKLEKIYYFSKKLFNRFFFRDYCRIDWRLNSAGEPYLIDVNANPGVNTWGYLGFIYEFAGKSHAELIDSIIQVGLKRLSKSH